MADYETIEEMSREDARQKDSGSRQNRKRPMFVDRATFFVLIGIFGNVCLTVFGGAYALGEMRSEVTDVRHEVDKAFNSIDDVGRRVDNLMTALFTNSPVNIPRR